MTNDSLGQLFKTTRIKQGFNLNQVAVALKLDPNYLKAIERNDFTAVPSGIYLTGYIKKYANFLGLNSELVASKYQQSVFNLSSSRLKRLKKRSASKIVVTSQLLLKSTTLIALLGITGYLLWQLIVYISPPKLEVISPSKDTVVTEYQLMVKGITQAGAEVTVNGQPVRVDESGNFSHELILVEGLYTITVQATDSADRKNIITRTVEVKR